jgi:hypothetical protein
MCYTTTLTLLLLLRYTTQTAGRKACKCGAERSQVVEDALRSLRVFCGEFLKVITIIHQLPSNCFSSQ